MMSNQAYFVSLVVLPNVITGPGEYVTRCGELVTIVEVGGRAAKFECLGVYPNGPSERWHRSGRLLPSRETDNDIVRAAT
jgi:hypothetical protein